MADNRSSRANATDKRLIPRIKELLKDQAYSLEELVNKLQLRYPDYQRKKKGSFTRQVDKAYDTIVRNEYNITRVEFERTFRKRDISERIMDSDDDSVIELETRGVDNNLMNGLVETTYRTHKGKGEIMITRPGEPTEIYESAREYLQHQKFLRHVDYMTMDSQVNDSEDVIVDKEPGPSCSSEEHDNQVILTPSPQPTDMVTMTTEGQDTARRSKRKRKKQQTNEDEEITEEIKRKALSDINVVHSTKRFKDFGGYEKTIKDVCQVLQHLKHPQVYDKLGGAPPIGLLLHGPPGCGKTLLANAIAGELDWPLIKLTSTEIVSGVSGESEEKLRSIFNKAKESAPCVLFIDDIEAISPKRDLAHREMERRIVTQLLACMDDLQVECNRAQVLVIGATSRVETLDPCLRRSDRFDEEICIGMPNEECRAQIMKLLIGSMRVCDSVNVRDLAHLTPGYVGADLSQLVKRAVRATVTRVLDVGEDKSIGEMISRLGMDTDSVPLDGVAITQEDFKVALMCVTPTAKKEGFATIPNITWDDVGALEGIRDELTMAILAPVRFPEQFGRLGLKQPPGILLAGPPGCGKTLLAKAIANESGINFISVKGPELLNMYVGESERAVRQVFQRARNSSPCVIFFDEIDSLCPKRSDIAENNSSARVVNQLLTEMDGLESRQQVYLMGATNRPDIIDPAILRPGRLDKTLYVGLPNSQDRLSILNTITKHGSKPLLAADVNLSVLSEDANTNGFSGADLAALVREASCIALKEFMSLTYSTIHHTHITDNTVPCIVSKKHFDAALTKVFPSVLNKDKLRIKK